MSVILTLAMTPTFRVRTTGRWLCYGLLRVLIGAGMAFAACAETPDWGAIAEWQGVIDYTETGSIDDDRNGWARVFSRSVDEHTVARFTLKRKASLIAADGIFTWTGEGTATINSLSRQNERGLDGAGLSTSTRKAGTLPADAFWLTIDTRQGTVSFSNGTPEGTLTETITGTYYHRVIDPTTLQPLIETESANAQSAQPFGIAAPFETQYPLPQDIPGSLTFSVEKIQDDYLRGGITQQKPLPQLTRRGHIIFTPVYADVAVEVSIDGYEQWRPEGSIKSPQQPGNHLIAQAKLVPRNEAAARNMPEVKRFLFELEGVSREPGVALNWPLDAKDKDPDLRLAIATVPGELSQEDQTFSVPQPLRDDADRPYATAQINAFDYGAIAELTVSAELDDGRLILGRLKTSAGERAVIKLPQRETGAWIADVWRKAHDVAGVPATDDAEDKPAGDGDGDGFTLYEEYRGFAVNGRHVEGDPRRKDFFVLNLIGADARAGIDLFEEVSGLRVHARLRRSEMSQKTRLMNGNHAEAPHRVDQHGVWIKQFVDGKDKTGYRVLGGSGAYTVLTRKGVAGRPGITAGIGILGRDDPMSDFVRPTSNVTGSHQLHEYVQNIEGPMGKLTIPAAQAALAYDRAIAHELLHSVGAEHHGSGNQRRVFWFQHANDPDNPTRHARLATASVGGTELTLLEEGSNRNLAEAAAAFIEPTVVWLQRTAGDQFRAEAQAQAVDTNSGGKSADYWAQRKLYDRCCQYLGYDLHIGVPHGEDSGADDCIMRYYFANAYPRTGSTTDFYLIPPGTNVAGLNLCHSAKGTGVNASDHKPQSRHGDAQKGNCAAQLSPNDAIPPRKL